jgi:hypothetical protein
MSGLFITKEKILDLVNRHIIDLQSKTKENIKYEVDDIIPWALKHPEDQPEMKARLIDLAQGSCISGFAYYCYLWARLIGDEAEMKPLFKFRSDLCCWWVVEHPEDKDEMEQFIKDNGDFKYIHIKTLWNNVTAKK